MSPSQSIHYTIYPKHPEAHLFEITCLIPNPDSQGQRLCLPNWIPGSYMIRDFAKNIVQLNANCGETELATTKINKSTWQISPCSGPLTIKYEVYAWDLSVRSAHLDTTHAYFNGASVFLAVEGMEASPCTVDILPPQGDSYLSWRVATSTARAGAELNGFGRYQADDYEDLIDHPVEIGDFSLASFVVAGVPHDVVISGRHRTDMTRLCNDLEKICKTHIELFGELPDMERYVFLIMAVGEGYGGLEHRSSTSLLCSRNDLPLPNQAEITENYRTFLGLCSHEYFHAWNVKRIKPRVFTPYDLSKETHTRQLWAFEGITSYYDDLCLARSGLISAQSYLELLGQTATRVWRGQGRFKQNVSDSSFDSWTKFYKQDESAPNNIVSYYTKGALIAFALDLTIRSVTKHTRSLDDVMRYLWLNYGKHNKGVEEGEIEQIISQIAAYDFADFFANYLYSTTEIPLQTLCEEVALEFTLRSAESADDKGGTPAKKQLPQTYLGARLEQDNQGSKLSFVFDKSPAQIAGLSAGDIIIACDGLKVGKPNLDQLIASYEANTEIKLHAFRRDELMEFNVTLMTAPADICVFSFKEDIKESILQHRNDWLHEESALSE